MRSRLALGRRDFLVSACGAASTLLAFNAANAAAGRAGGFFDLPVEAAAEPEAAAASLETGEFIFDVQGHYVDPTAAWLKVAPEAAFQWAPKAGCALADGKTPRSHLACLTSEEFVKDVFLDSDTDMMVLSFVPARRDASPLEIESADAVRRIVDRMEGNHRLMIHGRVNPNQPADVEDMEMLARPLEASAPGRPTRNGGRTARASSSTTKPASVSSKKRAGSASRSSACTRDCRSDRSPMSTASAATSVPFAKRFPGRQLPDLSLGLRHRRRGKGLRQECQRRRHRHAHPLAAGERYRARLQRLCRTRQHLAIPDARSGAGRARTRQAPEVLRTGQRALGHGLHLVRIAAGPDPGLPRLPDRRRSSASATATRRSRRRFARRSSA